MTRTAAPREQVVQVGPLYLAAAVQPSTMDLDARTVEVEFYAGGAIPWYEPRSYERCTITLSLRPRDVRLDHLNAGGPLCRSHDTWDLDSTIGAVVPGTARIEAGKAVATVRFAKDDEDAEKVWNKVRQGILRAVSVGAQIHKYEITEASEGQPMQCRALDWEPKEISVVPIGADPNARIRAAAEATPRNACVVVRAEEPTMPEEPRTETAPVQPAAPAVPETSTPAVAATPPVDLAAERERAAAAETQRVTGILALQTPGTHAAGMDAAYFRGHIERRTPLATVRAEVLERLIGAQTPTQINSVNPAATASVTDDQRDRWLRGAEAWLLMRAGMTEKIATAAQSPRYGHHFRAVANDPGEFRGFTLRDLAADALELRGVKTRGMDVMAVVWKAMRDGVTAAGGGLATRSEFAVLLENVMHKTLLAAYAIAPDTWRLFCGVGTVTDFRAHNRYRRGSLGPLEKLTEHGEFRVKSIPDGEKETIAADTRGNIIGITRKAIVDDDMSVFDGLAQDLGRAAALSIEVDVYASLAENAALGPLMNDGVSLFHANHNNISTGAALSVAALDGDRVKMGAQKDVSGNEILDLRPAVLVLPQSLGGEARTINDSQFDTDAVAANATNMFMKPNRVRGLFRTIVDSPRLSGTRRYLFVDPATHPVLEVVFLNGQQEPVIESWDPREFDGLRWRARHDYGVGGVDFRGAVTNAGA